MARSSTQSVGSYALPSVTAVIELLKPITWFPPMWAFVCGVVASGVTTGVRWPLLLGGIALTGPLVCGTSQAVNDWFDRDVDAINEPKRPIPSGRLPGRSGLYVAIAWTLASLVVAYLLGPWVLAAASLGLVLAWAYSMPPLRLKQNGWWGNSAVAACYEGLPWVTGTAVMLGSAPPGRVLLVAALYSIGAHGIMTLNDFKSVTGDRRMGIRSLPVQHGIVNAAAMACFIMALPQLVVIGLLVVWGHVFYAAGIGLLLLAQLYLMERLVDRPRELAPWYNATGVSLYVTGMLVSAFALRAIG